jgi:hypothetical protein
MSNSNSSNQGSSQAAVNNTNNQNTDQNLPEHPQANQPKTEAERRQQLQNAHLEDQDASVKFSNHHKSNDPEHKEIGDMHDSSKP